MPTLVIRLLGDLRASYWLWPGVMTLTAMMLAFGTIWLDERWGAQWIEGLEVFRFTHPDSARAVLGLVAQAMIGVAGVTFSITLVAVSFASSQFGPRLVGNFMRDTGNQVVLGSFIAAFTYAMIVLRAVEAVGEETLAETAFVPHLSVLTAIGLALLCVGGLVYFIHHVPNSIDIGAITARVGRDLKTAVSVPFPKGGRALPAGTPAPAFAQGRALTAGATGYVQSVDVDGLIDAARQGHAVIRLLYRPGDFVVAGDPLLLCVHADGRPAELWSEEDREGETRLRRCFAIGPEKTAEQNLLFLADELVEIAGLALSPGVNDPYTALTCLDWMEAALRQASTEDHASPLRGDEAGELRLVAEPVGFEHLIERMMARLTPYAAADAMAAEQTVRKLATLALHAPPPRRATVLAWLDTFAEAAEAGLPDGPVRERFSAGAAEAARIARADNTTELRLTVPWFGGSAARRKA